MLALEFEASVAVLSSFGLARHCFLANRNLTAAAPVNAPTIPAVAIAAKALSAAINLHVLVPNRVGVGRGGAHEEQTQNKIKNILKNKIRHAALPGDGECRTAY